MIDQDKRKAIFFLHEEGMSIREISRRLGLSRNTVRIIVKQKGICVDSIRKDKIKIDTELLRRLYTDCDGFIQRIHEKLAEQEGIKVGYSTLSRMIRELGFGQSKKQRCERVPDEPGAEMQHDTSPYKLKIGGKQLGVAASLIYYRYSKIRYLKFYRSFQRFKMKCFFHEALTFFGYTAPVCIIDNTNLARLRGTGKNAVIVPEMEQFAKQFGFRFVCHKVNHPNRKAGNERSFYTVETNFFPGRTFSSLEDLNRQAMDWATVRMANRPVSRSGLIPTKTFEHEKNYLIKIPPFVPPPYMAHKRDTDQYGYIPFDGNFYWIPGLSRIQVSVLQYAQALKIYHKRKLLAQYPLPDDGVKNKLISPQGMPKPVYKPKNSKNPTEQEEKKLRTMAEVDAYLNFALKPKGIPKHNFIRELFALYQKLALSLFIKTVKRAFKYRIKDIKSVERIAALHIRDANYKTPSVQIDEEFKKRESYLEGRLTEEPDLSLYDKMLEEDDE
jgi:transposase